MLFLLDEKRYIIQYILKCSCYHCLNTVFTRKFQAIYAWISISKCEGSDVRGHFMYHIKEWPISYFLSRRLFSLCKSNLWIGFQLWGDLSDCHYSDSTLNSSPLFWKDRYNSTSFSLFHFYHLEALLWLVVLGYLPRMVKYNKMSENEDIFKALHQKIQFIHWYKWLHFLI